MTTSTTDARTEVRLPRPDWQMIVVATLGMTTLLALLLAAFTWPPSDLEPRNLPVAVAAPPEAAAGIGGQLASALGEDAIDVHEVTDRAEAVAAVEDREAYGAIVVGADGAEVLTATAASPQVAQLLREVADQMSSNAAQQASGAPTSVKVTDVVPTPDSDPRGAVFNAGALPLAIGGIIVGALSSVALRRTPDRLVAVLLVGACGGLAMAAVAQTWLEALEGSYWANSGVITLGLLAIALPMVGLHHLMGKAGIGLVALLVLLVGNPLSGITSAPELLPLGWLGQLLPPGALGTTLRGTSYFDGAGTAVPLVVLACWILAGLTMALVPRRQPTA